MFNYNINEKALIFLSQFDFMTSTKFEEVSGQFENIGDIFSSDAKELFKLKSVLKTKYEIFLNELNSFNEKDFFAKLQKRGIGCLTILSKNYPEKLLRLKHPPYVLYFVGNLDLLKEKSIAVVGTRTPSNYGKIVTEKFAKELAENGLCLVSGLATGIDKIAHEGALAVNGKTIAVMGGGFDHIFPAVNLNLAREIGSKGLIVTEYYLSLKPTKYTFPTRNRIIAAISDAVLIPEAKAKSGSLYTKEYADELGLDTYCIPGNITSEKSEVPNKLIRQGAVFCALSPNDILTNFGISQTKKLEQKRQMQLTAEQSEIYNLLKDGEKDFEFLQEKTKYSAKTLNFNLTTLEISGIIRKLAGNSYMLNA